MTAKMTTYFKKSWITPTLIFALLQLIILIIGLCWDPGSPMDFSILFLYLASPLAAFMCSLTAGLKISRLKWITPILLGILSLPVPYFTFHTTGMMYVFLTLTPAVIGLITGVILKHLSSTASHKSSPGDHIKTLIIILVFLLIQIAATKSYRYVMSAGLDMIALLFMYISPVSACICSFLSAQKPTALKWFTPFFFTAISMIIPVRVFHTSLVFYGLPVFIMGTAGLLTGWLNSSDINMK